MCGSSMHTMIVLRNACCAGVWLMQSCSWRTRRRRMMGKAREDIVATLRFQFVEVSAEQRRALRDHIVDYMDDAGYTAHVDVWWEEEAEYYSDSDIAVLKDLHDALSEL